MNEILILGGTGKTGSRLARRLLDAGHGVRTASRTHGDVRFDLGEPSTWAVALDGIAAVYVLEPEVQGTEEGQRRIPRFVDAAAAAGVRRVVLLTAAGVDANETHHLWRAEQAVKNSGLEWTIVRPTWFAQNFSEDFWLPGILDGSLVLPVGDEATAFVDAEDIADVIVAALTHEGHNGQAYVLTGPRAISFAEAVDLIGEATGRTIRHVDISPDAFIQAQIANSVPAHTAELLTRIYTGIRDGDAADICDGTQRALGRKPGAFEDYVSAAAAAGAWGTR
ncbi:MAG TPA: NAD(P)H-binding protein [Trebonia sp.]|nr:NAD(P)H-binding protein [Trebonia sp.]